MYSNRFQLAVNTASQAFVFKKDISNSFMRLLFGRQKHLGLYTLGFANQQLHSNSNIFCPGYCPVLTDTHEKLQSARNAWSAQKRFFLKQEKELSAQQKRTNTHWKLQEYIPDLQRFLSEIGTDPKEARFWLKQFMTLDKKKPFAVIEIDPEIFYDQAQLKNTASSVSFLQRNYLHPVIVYGDLSPFNAAPQEWQTSLIEKGKNLCDVLRQQNLEPCLLFAGSGIIESDILSERKDPEVKVVNSDLIQWNLDRHIIPIIPATGVTQNGHIVPIGLWEVTCAISKHLQPLKVIKVNCQGGFQDGNEQVIPNIRLPFDFEAAKSKPWCRDHVLETIQKVGELLSSLPDRSSVVITSPDKMLKELFTHHGSGTFLKFTEPILKYDSFNKIDKDKLRSLLNLSFGKPLSENYFDDVASFVHTIYLSERYTAAAIILQFPDCAVPYLCKFAVSAQAQGEGTGEIVWESVQRDFKQLFWRSRGRNPINPWYFKNSEGSWSNGYWTVFWFGVPEPQLSTDLIRKALSVPDSFTTAHGPSSKRSHTAKS